MPEQGHGIEVKHSDAALCAPRSSTRFTITGSAQGTRTTGSASPRWEAWTAFLAYGAVATSAVDLGFKLCKRNIQCQGISGRPAAEVGRRSTHLASAPYR